MARPITDSDYDLDSISFFMLVNGTHPDQFNQEIDNDSEDEFLYEDENDENDPPFSNAAAAA